MSGLIGAAVALILGAPYGLVTFGLFGYNSVLTGMAFWSGPFTKTNKNTFAISVVGAAATAIVWMTMAHVMGDWFVLGGNGYAIPGFTASFIFTTWVMMYATKRYGLEIWPKSAEKEAEPATDAATKSSFKWTPKEFMKAVLNGVSQVTFIENWKTGIMWVVGLTLSFELVSGRIFTNAYTTDWNPSSPLFLAGVMALTGSAIGAGLAILTKLPTSEIRGGIHGFNQVLVMIALTSFLPLTWQTFLYAYRSHNRLQPFHNACASAFLQPMEPSGFNWSIRFHGLGFHVSYAICVAHTCRNWMGQAVSLRSSSQSHEHHLTKNKGEKEKA